MRNFRVSLSIYIVFFFVFFDVVDDGHRQRSRVGLKFAFDVVSVIFNFCMCKTVLVIFHSLGECCNLLKIRFFLSKLENMFTLNINILINI